MKRDLLVDFATIYARVIAGGVEEASRRGDSQEGVGVQGDARSDGEGLQPEGAGVYSRRARESRLSYLLRIFPRMYSSLLPRSRRET